MKLKSMSKDLVMVVLQAIPHSRIDHFSTYMILRYNLTHAKIDEVLWDVELREPELWQAWLEEQL